MLYLIGMGLNENGISLEGKESIERCGKIYLDNYTVEFPYPTEKIEKVLKRKIIPVERDFLESNKMVMEAKSLDVALLVYGNPLTATTHISLIEESRKEKVRFKIVYNASILDAVAETGLQLYKFGKTASMPSFSADSYIDIVKQNNSIKAHTLILIDIGLEFHDALDKLIRDGKNKGLKLDELVVCSQLGTENSEIYYNDIDKLKTLDIKSPFCIIVPGEMHFMEREFLESFR